MRGGEGRTALPAIIAPLLELAPLPATSGTGYTKADMDFHTASRASYGMFAAVNVKCRRWLEDATIAEYPAGFTQAWISEHVSEEMREEAWNNAVAQGWDKLTLIAQEIWLDDEVHVLAEGRCGGWAVLYRGFHRASSRPCFERDAVDTWTDHDMTKWEEFARAARAITDELPEAAIEEIYQEFAQPDGAPWAEVAA
jgi:hypothetical protein